MSHLIPLLLLTACNPAGTPEPPEGSVVASADWDAHRAAIKAVHDPKPNTGEAPELAEGTVSIAEVGVGLDGQVLVKVGSSTTEAFIVSDFPGFRDANNSDYKQDSTTTPDYTNDYDPHVSTTVCSPTDSACVAKDTYNYGPVPAPNTLPNTIPQGTQIREYKVFNRLVEKCNDEPPTITKVLRGWMYRERAVVNGQEKWNQHWFLHNTNAAKAYAFPTLCDPLSETQIDLVVEQTVVLDSSGNPLGAPRSLRTAVTELKNACTGSQTGCYICPTTTCDYAVVELDWMEYQ